MTALPAAGYASSASRKHGEMKQFLEDLRSVVAEGIGHSAISTLTIAAGLITPTAAIHAVDTEAAAATDDLTNIVTTNHPEGRIIAIRAANAGRAVVVRHLFGGAGEISLVHGASLTLATNEFLFLIRVGTRWEQVLRYGPPPVQAKSAAYTVIAADRDGLIDCTGTFTLSLTAAATLGPSFSFRIRNSGVGVITIDPAGAETIDGAATLAVGPKQAFEVRCDGVKFLTVGRSGRVLIAEGSVANAVDGTITGLVGYKRYDVELYGVHAHTAGASLVLLTSGDGVTFANAANDYKRLASYWKGADTADTKNNNTGTAASIILAINMHTDATLLGSFEFTLTGASDATMPAILGTGQYWENGGDVTYIHYSGVRFSNAVVTALRLLASAGNITFRYRVWGVS